MYKKLNLLFYFRHLLHNENKTYRLNNNFPSHTQSLNSLFPKRRQKKNITFKNGLSFMICVSIYVRVTFCIFSPINRRR
jgi:hypothetical protein